MKAFKNIGIKEYFDRYGVKNGILRGIIMTCPIHAYVNAGVLLINLKLWRENNLESQFVKFLRESNGLVEYNDQGVLNHVCKGRILIINPKYNFMIIKTILYQIV